MNRRSFITLAGGAITAAFGQRAQGASNSNVDKLILPTDTEVRTGGSRMIQIDGGYLVWTKKVGDAPIKVLLLHGGPGLDHSYFECFEDFLPPNGIEFYSNFFFVAFDDNLGGRLLPLYPIPKEIQKLLNYYRS